MVHDEGSVLLGTAEANACDRHGRLRRCRIICDPGSQISIVSSAFARILGLKIIPRCIPVDGIGPASVMTRGCMFVELHSMRTNGEVVNVEVNILDTISTDLPTDSVDRHPWSHLDGLALADPNFNKPGPIDLLVGADVWGMVLRDGVRTGLPHEPCAIKTCFGWVVLGRTSQRLSGASLRSNIVTTPEKDPLERLLQRFWAMEEPEDDNDPDDVCEQLFASTVTRDSTGRYCVQIPFREDAPSLGESFLRVRKQYDQLEARLRRSREVQEKYRQFMEEYIAMGHMERVTVAPEDVPNGYYIPHHAVLEKFRVVFNGSSATSTGVSLNDTQLTGPRLQDTLVNIIHRFRKYAVAMTADVEKMFRQVVVDPRHRRYQRILWRTDPDGPVDTYELKTVTYGLASSPFVSVRALRQCAVDNYGVIADRERGEAARDTILSSFYVDDMLTSVQNIDTARRLARDLDEILLKGKFPLRKWLSNDRQLSADLTGKQMVDIDLQLDDSSVSTVLGLRWNPVKDCFSYSVDNQEPDRVPTKRTVTSAVCRLYDPLGFLAPVLITAKMLIQFLWQKRFEWDQALPEDVCKEWWSFQRSLHLLSQINVQRWLGLASDRRTSFHGFCDASQRAYAAVIYARSVDTAGVVTVSIIAAKTRVAPVKETTIPRLELCAAELLTKLWKQISKALGVEEDPCQFYTDSTIVLSWIRNSPSQWKQFVSNRVKYIQEQTERNNWFHIRTDINPADCASRGIPASSFKDFALWWQGPPQLKDNRMDVSVITPMLSKEEQAVIAGEQKPVKVKVAIQRSTLLQTTIPSTEEEAGVKSIALVDRFSNIIKLQHTTAMVLRMCPSRRKCRGTSFVTTAEMEDALEFHVRQAQKMYLSDEYKLLDKKEPVATRSRIQNLNPYLDERGLIRVAGRLLNSELPLRQRKPVIVPRESSVCKLLIAHAHTVTLHGGIREMLQYLRKRFWIVTGRALVKAYNNKCRECKLHLRTTEQQQMAVLPRSRVQTAPPFLRSSVDYMGPFQVRIGGPRSRTVVKTYGVVFVCMVTRSVHLDLAENLSTSAFLDVYDRFIHRRGLCQVLFSDNGTQFVGADRKMKMDVAQWRSEAALQHLADHGTEWRFITAGAPHHGGLWEAAVKSTKKHLLKVVGQRVLSFNQLATLLVKIEGILNSRPMVALQDDLEEGMALTPAHFLVGRAILSRPEPFNDLEVPENRLTQLQLLRRMQVEFWKMFQSEYLQQLQTRGRMCRPVPNLCVNDVVAIKDENLPPTRWKIGRVTAVYPGQDGLVRTVEVSHNSTQQNEHGLYTQHTCQRPVQKLSRLVEASEDVQDLVGPAGGECSRYRDG